MIEKGITIYVAAAVKTEIELEQTIPPRFGPIKLRWAPGQIGALPVFRTREEAETWADGTCEVLEARVLENNKEASDVATSY